MISSHCPQCGESVSVPEAAFELDSQGHQPQAECPWCGESTPLSQWNRPPVARVLDRDGQALSFSAPVVPSQLDEGLGEPSFADSPLPVDANPDETPTLDRAIDVGTNDSPAVPDAFPSFGDAAETFDAGQFNVDGGDGELSLADAPVSPRPKPMRVRPAPARPQPKKAAWKPIVGALMGPILALGLAYAAFVALDRVPNWGFWPFNGKSPLAKTRSAAPPRPDVQRSQSVSRPVGPSSLASDQPLNPALAAMREEISGNGSVNDPLPAEILLPTPENSAAQAPPLAIDDTTVPPSSNAPVANAMASNDLAMADPARPELPTAEDSGVQDASPIAEKSTMPAKTEDWTMPEAGPPTNELEAAALTKELETAAPTKESEASPPPNEAVVAIESPPSNSPGTVDSEPVISEIEITAAPLPAASKPDSSPEPSLEITALPQPSNSDPKMAALSDASDGEALSMTESELIPTETEDTASIGPGADETNESIEYQVRTELNSDPAPPMDDLATAESFTETTEVAEVATTAQAMVKAIANQTLDDRTRRVRTAKTYLKLCELAGLSPRSTPSIDSLCSQIRRSPMVDQLAAMGPRYFDSRQPTDLFLIGSFDAQSATLTMRGGKMFSIISGADDLTEGEVIAFGSVPDPSAEELQFKLSVAQPLASPKP